MYWLIGIGAGIAVLIGLAGQAGEAVAQNLKANAEAEREMYRGKTLAEVRYDSDILCKKRLTLVDKVQTGIAQPNSTAGRSEQVANSTPKDNGRVLTDRSVFFDGL